MDKRDRELGNRSSIFGLFEIKSGFFGLLVKMAGFAKLVDSSLNPHTRIDMIWNDLTCTLNLKTGPRQILKNVSGYVKHGEFLAIMGSSGAGKSTLLNILSNRLVNTSKVSITGQILINSNPPHPDFYSEHIGYVTQEEHLIECMTVFECFMFAARLKTQHSDKKARVLKLIEKLKLENCKNTYIGGPYVKGISGGEKKRTSIGIELITEPSVLFLDEPTSGLDSYTALILMKLILSQVSEGKTVISTIHQPSSDIFHLFDKLLLLTDGQVAYHGLAKDSVSFFESAGFVCPMYTNPADYYMEVLYVKNSKALTDEEQEVSQKLVNLQKSSKVTGTFLESPVEENESNSRTKTGLLTQCYWVFLRGMNRVLRNHMIGSMRLVIVVLIAFMQLIFYWDIGTSGYKAQFNRDGFLFFTLACLTFCNILACVLIFPSMRNIMVKEYQSNTYGILAYFFAQNLNDLIFDFFLTIGYVSSVYWGVGLNQHSGEVVFKFYLITFLALYTGGSMGMLCGCAFDRVDLALGATSGLLFPFMYFAGFYRSGTLPSSFKWAKYCSPFFYLFQAYMKNQYSTLTITDCYKCPSGFPKCDNDCTPLDDFDIKLDENTSILVISLINIGIRIGALIIMRLSVRKTKLSN